MKNKVYVFDIDGTICTASRENNNYSDSKPYVERIKKINKLYEEGNIIYFMTARGMGRHNNDRKKSIDQFYEHTLNQLKSWNVKFHDLFLGKPAADFYIDDKGIKDSSFFGDNKE